MAQLSLRRLRQDPHIRELVREVHLSHTQFIQPLFVVEGLKKPEAISGLSGTMRDTPTSLLKQIETDLKKGVSKFLLFGVSAKKELKHDFTASQIANIKKQFGKDIWLGVDVCLCSSTTHGQCGILNLEGDHIDNGKTVKQLAAQAKLFTESGADCVAPSDMMDGRIAAIRASISERTVLMSYAAKFHSGFYGPFRNAADSAPKNSKLKDRATYQIDPAHPSDALRASQRDADEGADILMVKPALLYLDILAQLSTTIPLPWAAYQVSGEYASIELMAREGLINRERAHIECWQSFARTGASIIISYGARYAKEWISNV